MIICEMIKEKENKLNKKKAKSDDSDAGSLWGLSKMFRITQRMSTLHSVIWITFSDRQEDREV
jgi:hypothetical protein